MLSNEEVVAIVGSCPTRACAARAVVDSAVKEWRYRYPTSKVDDCAVVCLFLKSEESSNSGNSSTLEEDENHPEDPNGIIKRCDTVRRIEEG